MYIGETRLGTLIIQRFFLEKTVCVQMSSFFSYKHHPTQTMI
jgi:hypothetical protein